MNRPVHFEIHATDPEKIATFYSAVFGWEIKEWIIPGVTLPEENRYWLVTTGPNGVEGINGGVVKRRGEAPVGGEAVNAYVCTMYVEDLDAILEKAIAHGGVLALPKMPIKGMGYLAYAKDTDGNLFGMMQADATAQ
ncbi:MAG: VOC family protein [Patescibacteria group bacterium]